MEIPWRPDLGGAYLAARNTWEIHGNTWKQLETPGNTWKYLEILGNTWKYLEIPCRPDADRDYLAARNGRQAEIIAY